MNEQLIKRIKSLAWRAGMMGLAAAIDVVLTSLNTLELPPIATIFLGLALGEISKWLNTK